MSDNEDQKSQLEKHTRNTSEASAAITLNTGDESKMSGNDDLKSNSQQDDAASMATSPPFSEASAITALNVGDESKMSGNEGLKAQHKQDTPASPETLPTSSEAFAVTASNTGDQAKMSENHDLVSDYQQDNIASTKISPTVSEASAVGVVDTDDEFKPADNDDLKAQGQKDTLAPLKTSPTISEVSAITVVNTGEDSKPTDMNGLPSVMAEIGVAEKSPSPTPEDTPEDTQSPTATGLSITEIDILATNSSDQADKDEDSDAASTTTAVGDEINQATDSTSAEPPSSQAVALNSASQAGRGENSTLVTETPLIGFEMDEPGTCGSSSKDTSAEKSDMVPTGPVAMPYKSIFGPSRSEKSSDGKAIAGSSSLTLAPGSLAKIYDVKKVVPSLSIPQAAHSGHFSADQAYNDQDAAGPSSSMSSSSGFTEPQAMSAKAKGKQPATSMNHDAGFTVADVHDNAPGNEDSKGHGIVDLNGNPATDSTPPTHFKDWTKYLVFCEQGKKVCCQFGTMGDNGNMKVEKKIYVPQKLLCDFSTVMKRMLTGPWVEAQTLTMTLDDIDANDFYRLIQILKAGMERPQINLGKPEKLLSDLFKVHILADRYLMVEVKYWVTAAILGHIEYLAHTWKPSFQRDVIHGPGSGRASARHHAQMKDVADVYDIIAAMDESRTPVQLSELVEFIILNCPRPLVVDLWHEMSSDMTNEIGFRLASSTQN